MGHDGSPPIVMVNGRDRDGVITSLQPIFTEFHDLLEQYCKGFQYKEAPYCFTEMTSVAMLSSAAIKHNWYSICEYQALKRNRENSRENSYGRVDLYLSSGDDEIVCEAKRVTSYSKNLVGRKAIDNAISSVRRDVRNTVNNRGERDQYLGLGLIFIPHYQTDADLQVLGRDRDIELFKSNLEIVLRPYENAAYAYFKSAKPVTDWIDRKSLHGLATILLVN